MKSLLTFTAMCWSGSGIAVRVFQREAEVEAGVDGPAALLHEPDVHDFQDILINRVPRCQARGGAAVAIRAGCAIEIDGVTRQPVGALHDLYALYLIGLGHAVDHVVEVVLFDDEQGIVVVERELGVVRGGDIGVPLDQVRVLHVYGTSGFVAIGVDQIEDHHQILAVADAVELDDDTAGRRGRLGTLRGAAAHVIEDGRVVKEAER